MPEIIPLEDHVVEFEEGQRLLAIESQPDRIEGQHAVDGEMRADSPQQVDVGQLVKPVGVIGHDRVGWTVAEGQVPLEHPADRSDIGLDFLMAE
jgi:hypothetical protein